TEPAKLTKLVRGELDWIVMKALEKDRSRRYETANGFAMDVQRYLADEPVQACPPSAWYRFRKFARRNKGPLLAASFVLLALVGGIVGTSWQAMQATGERNAKQEALDGLAEEELRTQAALSRSQRVSAELDFDKGQLLGESGDPNLALLWLARSLKLAPPDAVQMQAAIRTNFGAWRRQMDSLRMVLTEEGPFAVAFAPDGKIVTVSGRPESETVTVR